MYINSFCSISPAGVLTPGSSSASLQPQTAPRAACTEPDYRDLIPPMQLRRMTKPVRTGVAAAKLCLQAAAVALPDAIHAGTAYGMLEDSEQFLRKMIDQEEQMLTPTAFIQSTHNTVAGQIALALGCNAHNMTFVHKAHSFESAVLDAGLMTEDHPSYQVLAGAVDECTDTSFSILERMGLYHEANTAGEGAAFFLLSATAQTGRLARIRAFDMFTAGDSAAATEHISSWMQSQQLDVAAGDILLQGAIPTEVAATVFKDNTAIDYKQYCGEFPTASAFGLSMAVLLLQENKTARCWICNRSGRHYSIWCLEK